MGRQHRESQTARWTKITLYPLFEALLRTLIPPVTSMTVHHLRTTVGTPRPLSSELIFPKLHRGRSPNSSPPIKPLSCGHHDAPNSNLLPNVSRSRSPRTSQRYIRETPCSRSIACL